MRHKRWVLLSLVPFLLSGCAALGLSGPKPGASASAIPSPGASWIIVQPGKSAVSSAPVVPSTSPTPYPTGFLPIARPAAPVPRATPVVTCSPNTFDFSKIGTADVTPSATSAVVSWYNVGGYNLVRFRLTAISQDLRAGSQREVGFVDIDPRTPCGQMSATITGLSRRTGYVFSVDAVVYRKSGAGTHAATVARSHAVRTL
jgi:hypothetical protein